MSKREENSFLRLYIKNTPIEQDVKQPFLFTFYSKECLLVCF